MLSTGDDVTAPINWRDLLVMSTDRRATTTTAPPYADLRRREDERATIGLRLRDVESTTGGSTSRQVYLLTTRNNPQPRRVRHFKGRFTLHGSSADNVYMSHNVTNIRSNARESVGFADAIFFHYLHSRELLLLAEMRADEIDVELITPHRSQRRAEDAGSSSCCCWCWRWHRRVASTHRAACQFGIRSNAKDFFPVIGFFNLKQPFLIMIPETAQSPYYCQAHRNIR